MSFRPPSRIDLAELEKGTIALTPAVCANLAEAAACCLEQGGHQNGVAMSIEIANVTVNWRKVDERAAASRADKQEATEEGAVAIAIQLIRGGTNYEVVERSWKGTGFDWFLGLAGHLIMLHVLKCLEL